MTPTVTITETVLERVPREHGSESDGPESPEDTRDSREDDPDALASRVADLHGHLAATAERPIDPTTNRWLGEAEAVAEDAASPGLDPETRRKRVRQVEGLLAAADDPDDEEAAAHLEAAREACTEILAGTP